MLSMALIACCGSLASLDDSLSLLDSQAAAVTEGFAPEPDGGDDATDARAWLLACPDVAGHAAEHGVDSQVFRNYPFS